MARNTWSDEQLSDLMALKAQGKSYVEIGTILGKNHKTVKSRYYRDFLRQNPKRPQIPWEQKEDDFLLRIAKKLPRVLTVKNYNAIAKEYGFPSRTPSAINWRLNQLGQASAGKNEYLTRSTVGLGLGFGDKRINLWILDGLKGTRYNKIIYINKSDLIDYITTNPETLKGITEFGMAWFLSLVKEVRECDRNANKN